MMKRKCRGGDCAQVCPFYNPGAACPTPVEMLAWFRANRDAALDWDRLLAADALIH